MINIIKDYAFPLPGFNLDWGRDERDRWYRIYIKFLFLTEKNKITSLEFSSYDLPTFVFNKEN